MKNSFSRDVLRHIVMDVAVDNNNFQLMRMVISVACWFQKSSFLTNNHVLSGVWHAANLHEIMLDFFFIDA